MCPVQAVERKVSATKHGRFTRTEWVRSHHLCTVALTYFNNLLWKMARRYDALYTCVSSKAIHIMAVHFLSTYFFIISFRRFVGNKSDVRMNISDIGSNLVETSSEFTRSFQEMDHIRISNFLEENVGKWMLWKRNPPLLKNTGGVSKPYIQIARAILNSLLKTHGNILSNESLQTKFS